MSSGKLGKPLQGILWRNLPGQESDLHQLTGFWGNKVQKGSTARWVPSAGIVYQDWVDYGNDKSSRQVFGIFH
jgi:hypothetical protein